MTKSIYWDPHRNYSVTNQTKLVLRVCWRQWVKDCRHLEITQRYHLSVVAQTVHCIICRCASCVSSRASHVIGCP